ncbi:putative glutathione-specific gamma-glutamylcyclotransferase 2 [Tubulanus polymorphus]|uniref:putative glutathione-specific gamma-glutamylcyclotransferase 2 n=1 Tax=Tubulanus polymorphus TaxID=672921 RepID=UPI003DA2E0F0
MWVFGYGSLIWKVDFPYKRKLVGTIKGYVRRFWQGSEDHRGIPGKPGRVVTLVKSDNPEDIVWGIAYEIADCDRENVRKHLDFREKCGYERTSVTFHPADNNNALPFELTIYLGTPDNPHFLGPAPMKDIAYQIYTSIGPSGKNSEYLFELVEALNDLVVDHGDKHLIELYDEVKKLNIYEESQKL